MYKNASEEFERTLVALVCQLASERGMNFSQLAQRAYKEAYDEQSAVVKWRRQRKEDNPQAVSVANAYSLAQALGIDFPDLIFRTQAQLRMKKEG